MPWLRRIVLTIAVAAPVGFGAASGTARAAAEESVDEAVCRFIGAAASKHKLPAGFLTRLVWRESSFRSNARSPVGAQGIAQFMPGTAAERGLTDPFDPEQAIMKAAEFLAELKATFGNLGLAAAAYNGGPARVASWLARRGGLPTETRDYVYFITRRSAEEWAAEASGEAEAPAEPASQPCLELVAVLRGPGMREMMPSPFAPWGVQIAANFSRARALESYRRESRLFAGVLGEIQPMIIGTRLRARGRAPFYRVRVPAQTRAEANELCGKIRSAGGNCVVLKS